MKNLLQTIYDKFRLPFVYLAIYTALFWSIRSGIGQYWDWSLPYYRDQLGYFFGRAADSWITADFGSVMGYKSDTLFRWVAANLVIIPLEMEYIVYGAFVILFSLGSLIAYQLCRHFKISPLPAFLVSLIIFINPATFYKMVAGHYLYFISFNIFLLLIWFLHSQHKKTFNSHLALGLLLGLISPQFQFLIFGYLYLGSWLLFNRKKFDFRYLIVTFITSVLCNLTWLYNFIFGVINLEQVSSTAQKGSFLASASQSLQNIANLTFSKATLINKYYDTQYQLVFVGFTAIFLLIFSYKLIRIKSDKTYYQLVVFFIVLIFLSTGVLQDINLPIISSLAPILREVGHFAPLIIAFASLTLFYDFDRLAKALKFIIISYFIIFLGVNITVFWTSLPVINYADARKQFDTFKNYDLRDNSQFRVLTYPFFGQYSFNNKSARLTDGFSLDNSGWDSFGAFSGLDVVNNGLPKENFVTSPLYKLITTKDLKYLEENNIRYIYDFSDIYESNVNKYVPPSAYANDLSLIKNNPNLFNELLEQNPGRLTKLDSHIYRVNYASPRIIATRTTEFSQINPTTYNLTIKNIKDTQELTLLDSFHPSWQVYINQFKNRSNLPCQVVVSSPRFLTSECTKETIQHNATSQNLGLEHYSSNNKFNKWLVDSNYIKSKVSQDYYQLNSDNTIDIDLVITFEPQKNYTISQYFNNIFILVALIYLVSSSIIDKYQKNSYDSKNQID